MLEYIVGVKDLADWVPFLPREVWTNRYHYYVDPKYPCYVSRQRFLKQPVPFRFPARVVALVRNYDDKYGASAILSNGQVYDMYNSVVGHPAYNLTSRQINPLDLVGFE